MKINKNNIHNNHMKMNRKGQEPISWTTLTIIIAVVMIIVGLILLKAYNGGLNNLFHKMP
jgi:uncharacterized membrane protein